MVMEFLTREEIILVDMFITQMFHVDHLPKLIFVLTFILPATFLLSLRSLLRCYPMTGSPRGFPVQPELLPNKENHTLLLLSLPWLCFALLPAHATVWCDLVHLCAHCLLPPFPGTPRPLGSGATSPSPSADTPPHKRSLLHTEERLNTRLLDKLANH